MPLHDRERRGRRGALAQSPRIALWARTLLRRTRYLPLGLLRRAIANLQWVLDRLRDHLRERESARRNIDQITKEFEEGLHDDLFTDCEEEEIEEESIAKQDYYLDLGN